MNTQGWGTCVCDGLVSVMDVHHWYLQRWIMIQMSCACDTTMLSSSMPGLTEVRNGSQNESKNQLQWPATLVRVPTFWLPLGVEPIIDFWSTAWLVLLCMTTTSYGLRSYSYTYCDHSHTWCIAMNPAAQKVRRTWKGSVLVFPPCPRFVH